jgi:hypothetical protein
MMLVCTVRASGIERGCLALVVNGKIGQWPLLCSAGKKRGSWLGRERARTADGRVRVRVRIAWHHNRLTFRFFYLSKRVGEETSVMNVESAL